MKNLPFKKTSSLKPEKQTKHLPICIECGAVIIITRNNGRIRKRCKSCASPSICWFCANGYATRCSWVPRGERVWSQAREVLINDAERNTAIVYKVTECEDHVREETAKKQKGGC